MRVSEMHTMQNTTDKNVVSEAYARGEDAFSCRLCDPNLFGYGSACCSKCCEIRSIHSHLGAKSC